MTLTNILSIQENYCMTLTFAILLGIIFLMEIGAGIAAYHLKGQVLYALHIRCTINPESLKGLQQNKASIHEVLQYCICAVLLYGLYWRCR